jgi:hypothetical protein
VFVKMLISRSLPGNGFICNNVILRKVCVGVFWNYIPLQPKIS